MKGPPEGMVLVYHLDARARGTSYFRVGLNLEADIGDEANFNIGLNHVWYPIDGWGREVRTEGQIGDTQHKPSRGRRSGAGGVASSASTAGAIHSARASRADRPCDVRCMRGWAPSGSRWRTPRPRSRHSQSEA